MRAGAAAGVTVCGQRFRNIGAGGHGAGSYCRGRDRGRTGLAAALVFAAIYCLNGVRRHRLPPLFALFLCPSPVPLSLSLTSLPGADGVGRPYFSASFYKNRHCA